MRFEINQLIFSDDTALVADSEEKCWVSLLEYAKEKSWSNVVKSKVMKRSKYGNGGSNVCGAKRRTVRGSGLFEEPVVESRADGGCGTEWMRDTELGKRWKSVLSNRGLRIKAKKCRYEGGVIIKIILIYGTDNVHYCPLGFNKFFKISHCSYSSEHSEL